MPRVTVEEHFSKYTGNNRIKHEILTRYLRGYTQALSKHAGGFHYIDGFAGSGSYAGEAGSPIRALQVLAERSQPFSMSLVEDDQKTAEALRNALSSEERPKHLFDDPLIEVGEFSNHLQKILSRRIYSAHQNVATFAFLDPCRASGYGAKEIQAILQKPYGECLIFWNYDGVNRWLGAVSSNHSSGQGLSHMFGTQDSLNKALEISCSSRNPSEKEHELLAHFIESVRQYSGATFLIPFRFTSDTTNRTSHYLVHCSKDALAFKIMKDVMGSLRSNSDPGQFSFLGQSDLGDQLSMFVPEASDTARKAIKSELAKGRRMVRIFSDEWIQRPKDLFRPKDYKDILREMERDGDIAVLGKDGITPTPADKRRKIKGIPSLADELYIQLRRS